MYLDSAYIVKLYLTESGSDELSELARRANRLCSSALAIAEVHCVILRRLREGRLTSEQCAELIAEFGQQVENGFWAFAPVSNGILKRTSTIPLLSPEVILRAGDAIHLLTAQDLGEREIWTGDRHMLAAAPYFGLIGRSVS